METHADDFDLDPDLCYLNHAAVSPWPARAADAVRRFALENARDGAEHYARWLETEGRLRAQLAALINAASADDVALLKNTSEGLSIVAHGLEWQAGDNVIISDQEFPSNRIVWESLRPYGVEIRAIPLSGEDPETNLLSAIDSRTRLLAVSAVQYGSGLRADLHRLGSGCRAAGVLFCVDAIQWIGALRFDVRGCEADFVAADGHKWMMGPEGVALFYVRPELRDSLRLRQYGWNMVEQRGDYDRKDWTVAASARRFECGSPNMLGITALQASSSLLLQHGMAEVEGRVLARSRYLIDRLEDMPRVELLTDPREARHAGIVTFRHRDVAPAELYGRLREARVICAQRGGGIRFSPHYYTPESQLDLALERLERAVDHKN